MTNITEPKTKTQNIEKITANEVRNKIASKNPDFAYIVEKNYRETDIQSFGAIISAATKIISPIYMTHHPEDGDGDRYRAWLQLPKSFMEGRRSDWGCNQDIALAEINFSFGIEKLLRELTVRAESPIIFNSRCPLKEVEKYIQKIITAKRKQVPYEERCLLNTRYQNLRQYNIHWSKEMRTGIGCAYYYANF